MYKLALSFSLVFISQVILAEQVEITVIDTGAGHASVTKFPNGDIFVYDTGHYSHDPAVFDALQDVIGDADIDLMVISHSDADHLGACNVVI